MISAFHVRPEFVTRIEIRNSGISFPDLPILTGQPVVMTTPDKGGSIRTLFDEEAFRFRFNGIRLGSTGARDCNIEPRPVPSLSRSDTSYKYHSLTDMPEDSDL